MKKITAILLAMLLLATMLAGCAPSGNPTTPTSPSEKTPVDDATEAIVSEMTDDGKINLSYVGMIFPSLNAEMMVRISNDVKASLEARGVKVEVVSSDDDQARQLELVENFGEKGVDGLFLMPIGASDIGGALAKLQEKGIRVVTIANKVDKGYDVMCLTDYAEQGAQCAKIAAEWIEKEYPDAEPGSVEVGLLTVKMSPEAAALSEGLKKIEEFTDKAVIVDEIEMAFSDPETTVQNNTEIMLGKNPNLKCILCYSIVFALAADEIVMRSPAIDNASFAIFANNYQPVMGERILLTETGESCIRGTTLMGTGTYAHYADLLFGEIEVGEDNIYYEVITPVTIDNVQDIMAN